MSRFVDDGGEEDFPGQWELWRANAERALKGRRGRKVLADLREALMALPAQRLIDSALCTVGAERRLGQLAPAPGGPSEAEACGPGAPPDVRYAYWSRRDAEEKRNRFAEIVEHQGEGVCVWGAYLWYQKVKAGADPAEAFDNLPLVFDGDEDTDSAYETAMLAKEAGVVYSLAWDLAYKNDETFYSMTPERRHAAMVAWIDQELGTAPELADAAK